LDKSETLMKVKQIISDVLDLPDVQLTRETTAEEVEGWDSLNHINIILAVEQHFGIKVRTAEIEELRNVGELVDVVDSKMAGK
jgi:acyl carrier protein